VDPTKRRGRWDWLGHPLTTSIVGTVVGGLVVAAILGLLH
jgi:hypothetical protein